MDNCTIKAQDILSKAKQLHGMTLAELARKLNQILPQTLLQAKGWPGQLVELYLGAQGIGAEVDFPAAQLELKTLPVSAKLIPSESTYICTLDSNLATDSFETSWLAKKMQRILWVPITNQKSLRDREFLQPFISNLVDNEYMVIKKDFEEIMEAVCLGHESSLNASYGTYLHLRPKAANNKITKKIINFDGFLTNTGKKGFYLRTNYTKQLLVNHINK